MKIYGCIALLLAFFLAPPVWAGHGVQLGATLAVVVEGDANLTDVRVLVNDQAYSLNHQGQFVTANWPSGSYEISLQLPDSLEMVGDSQTIQLTDGSSATVTLAVAERSLSVPLLGNASAVKLRLLAIVGLLLYIGWRLTSFRTNRILLQKRCQTKLL